MALSMNRRQLFRFFGSTGLLLLHDRSIFSEEKLIPAVSVVDHLLLGVADLDKGIAWVEEQTGVKAVIGGVHPGMGTRNALLSLGERKYLEIIGPDPQQKSYNFPLDIRTLPAPRLITWAAAAAAIEKTAEQARAAGLQPAGPFDGSRNKPDGTTLRWKTLFIPAQFQISPFDPIPFFIQWSSESKHPSEDSPKGCSLQSLEIEHPKSELLAKTLKDLGIDAKVKQSQSVRLIATLQTPKGQVQIS